MAGTAMPLRPCAHDATLRSSVPRGSCPEVPGRAFRAVEGHANAAPVLVYNARLPVICLRPRSLLDYPRGASGDTVRLSIRHGPGGCEVRRGGSRSLGGNRGERGAQDCSAPVDVLIPCRKIVPC